MNAKQHKTLSAVFSRPTASGVKFSDLENLIRGLGGNINEGAGSRLSFHLFGAVFHAHRPHPGKDAKKYQLEALRDWLTEIGVSP